jgi:hypothetical protein
MLKTAKAIRQLAWVPRGQLDGEPHHRSADPATVRRSGDGRLFFGLELELRDTDRQIRPAGSDAGALMALRQHARNDLYLAPVKAAVQKRLAESKEAKRYRALRAEVSRLEGEVGAQQDQTDACIRDLTARRQAAELAGDARGLASVLQQIDDEIDEARLKTERVQAELERMRTALTLRLQATLDELDGVAEAERLETIKRFRAKKDEIVRGLLDREAAVLTELVTIQFVLRDASIEHPAEVDLRRLLDQPGQP